MKVAALLFRMYRLCEWILCWVEIALGEVVVDLLNGDTHVLENLPEILTLMAEHNGAVVWVVLLDEAETIFPPIISLFQKKSLPLPT